MGTEVAISFSSLRTELENEKSSLYKIDESIKKIVQSTGRYPNDRFNNPVGDYSRGPRTGRNVYHVDSPNNHKSDDLLGKRKHETKTVFSRLSARVNDSDGEGEEVPRKPRMPSAVWRELPSRADVLRAQGSDEQSRVRNRRIFGSLLGTLQKFKQEEIVLQTKEEKKAQVERKIEEQARLEKEREQRERKTLFAEREHKKATIKALEAKMIRVQEFEKWELLQRPLSGYIRTKAKPHLYWLPKKLNDKAAEKLTISKKYHERYMVKKRQDLHEELQRIEQQSRRPRPPAAKENDPNSPQEHPNTPRRRADSKNDIDQLMLDGDDKTKKRDKFAMEVDAKEEDSDDDAQHTPAQSQNEPEETTEKSMEVEEPVVSQIEEKTEEETTDIPQQLEVEKSGSPEHS